MTYKKEHFMNKTYNTLGIGVENIKKISLIYICEKHIVK